MLCPPVWGAQNTPLAAVCLVLAAGVAGPDSPTSAARILGSLRVIFLFETEAKVAQTGLELIVKGNLELLIPSHPLSAGITGVQAPLIAVCFALLLCAMPGL